MKKHVAVVLLAGLSLGAQSASFTDRCFLVMCSVQGSYNDTCSIAPSKLKAVLPPGFSITSIRNFTYVSPRQYSGGEFGEQCPRVTRLPLPISLDVGNVYGAIPMAGTLKSAGTLRYEPSEGGTLEFRLSRESLGNGGRFFREQFVRLKLDSAKPTPSVAPPKQLMDANCWQATAVLEATGFSLLIGASSEAGTYVESARLSDVRDFRACRWGGP